MNGDEPVQEKVLERELFRTVKHLIKLRTENDALKYGVLITLWSDHFVFSFLRYYKNNIALIVFNNGYQAMPFPLNIPFIRNTNKELQSLPDRILDEIQNNTFINAFDSTDQVHFNIDHIPVSVPGKSFKIYILNT